MNIFRADVLRFFPSKPDRIVWVDGTEEERKRLADEACSTGELKDSLICNI